MKIQVHRLGLIFCSTLLCAVVSLHAQEPQTREAPAQQQPSSEQQKPPSSNEQNAPHVTNPNAAASRELVEASRAAEGEPEKPDQQSGLKHSVAVRWIAKTTGITVETAYWIAMAINFAIVFVAIAWFMRSSLPGYFRARNEAIQQGISEAHAASEDAKRRLADIEMRLSRLDAEVADVRASAEKESAAEEGRIRAAAEADVKRILESAEQEIDAAGRQARRDLRTLAAGLAVDLAAQRLQVDEATDESLVRNFVSQLGKDGR